MASARGEGQQLYRATDGGIVWHGGQFQPAIDAWQSEPLDQGIKLIVMESGALRCQLPGEREVNISGPALCAVWNQDQAEALQCFVSPQRVAFTSLSYSHEMLRSLPSSVHQQLAQGLQLDHVGRPRLHVTALPAPLLGLRAQLSALPKQGSVRQLLLQSKALEVMAYTLDALTPAPLESALRLSSRDLDALHGAQRLLEQQMDAPPTLQALSVQLGINRRKLTEGFRQLFGVSVYEWLHHRRLETAWQLLQRGELNVASVAYQVGFTPAHLSVAFKKKFGLLPKQLKR